MNICSKTFSFQTVNHFVIATKNYIKKKLDIESIFGILYLFFMSSFINITRTRTLCCCFQNGALLKCLMIFDISALIYFQKYNVTKITH